MTRSSGKRLRPSPGEIQAQLELEQARRRRRRLQQVRQKSAEASKQILKRAQEEKQRKVKEVTLEQLARYRQEKVVELALLEEEYQRCLRDIGMGHKGAKEAHEYDAWLQRQKHLEHVRAEARGAEAMLKERKQRELNQKLKENKQQVRKSALLAEKLRSAEVRQKIIEKRQMELVEIDENETAKVTLVSRGRLIKTASDQFSARVRRIPLSNVSNGLEAAILEQEEAQRAQREVKHLQEETEAAKQRAILKHKSLRPISPLSISSCSSSDDPKRLSTIMEVSEVSSRSRIGEVDIIPVRGPSSAEDSLDDMAIKRPKVPQPTGYAAPPKLTDEDLQGIQSLLQRVGQQREDLEGQKASQHFGEGAGVKNDQVDRAFVAKVLGVPTDVFDQSKVMVKINIEEVSTLASSSDSLGQERFLPDTFNTTLTDYQPIHELIEQLKFSSSSLSSSTTSSSEIDPNRATKLRYYIEKLLSMKREEIAELSISTTSLSTPSPMAGSQSSSEFVSSTPVSILSTSSSSKSSSGGSKTVRFKDDLDGTYQSRGATNVEAKAAEIEKKTKESLKQIHQTFEKKKLEIEKALQKRYEIKAQRLHQLSLSTTPSLSSSSSNGGTISEGPLSDSVSAGTPHLSPSIREKEDIVSSSSDSDRNQEEVGGVLKQLKMNWAHAMFKRMHEEKPSTSGMNKSSSSGSSGSAALAELQAKLAKMEMPQLVKPLSAPTSSTNRSEEDTLARVTELSSFHASGEDEPGISDQAEISLVPADDED